MDPRERRDPCASREFDKFPFGLLTMVVSLEAIFLATFVMVTQNRQGKRADIRRVAARAGGVTR